MCSSGLGAEPHHEAGRQQHIVSRGLGHEAAAGGDHHPLEARDDGLQALPLESAEHRLTMHGEDLGQLHAAGALDLAVELHERHGQRLGGELTQRGLAGTAQADQGDATLRRCSRLAEPLGDEAPCLNKVGRREALQLVQGERQVDRPLRLRR